MNRCPNCAAQNREGAKFCTSCGFRLPVTSTPTTSSDRSPFATTSSVPPYAEQVAEPPRTPESAEESGFATWNAPAPQPTETPGRSWDAPPPQNTAVPVDEDMIAALVGEAAPDEQEDVPAESAGVTAEPTPEAPDPATWATPQPAAQVGQNGAASVDQLLRLVRELEYGLVELAESPASTVGSTSEAPAGDTRMLANALSDLQDEDDLMPLRNAVASAQDRPRDVDVMLDLVLRADAIAAVITERDQLKAAIELAVGGKPGADSQPTDDTDNGTAAQDEVVAESTSDDVAADTMEPAETADSQSQSI
jgi:zinc ribbon protein